MNAEKATSLVPLYGGVALLVLAATGAALSLTDSEGRATGGGARQGGCTYVEACCACPEVLHQRGQRDALQGRVQRKEAREARPGCWPWGSLREDQRRRGLGARTGEHQDLPTSGNLSEVSHDA